MARVVQRRSAPPYLLIVFVFLFLISAILAVLGFMGGGEEKKQNASLKTQVRELQDGNNELKNDVKDLVQRITGQTNLPAASAISVAEKAYENPVVKTITASGRFGLAKELETLAATIAELQNAGEGLKKNLEEKEKALEKQAQAAAAQQKTHERQLAERNGKIEDLNKALAEEKALRDSALQEVQETLSKSKKELQQELLDKEKRLEERVLEIGEKEKKIRRLEDELQKMHGMRKTEVVNKADGQIEKIARNAGICYVNLGKKDDVQPGMTLAVYSKKGVKKENIKGSLVVTNVSENFSECKIVREDKNAPIVVGDDVANIAYHPVRKHVFVVKGLFDLHGTGNASATGADQVKDIIRKAGGVVEEEVGYQTDYIVLGEEPTKPTEPEDDAPNSVQLAYQKQMERYQEYTKLRNEAAALRIPILNTNRFILLTGYEPEPEPE
ncbi:MAG: hypothetical protein JXA11_01905 [Phycisphaerae bacterium]|nr:hypothetical protein [Phycisphaerae bacterium]